VLPLAASYLRTRPLIDWNLEVLLSVGSTGCCRRLYLGDVVTFFRFLCLRSKRHIDRILKITTHFKTYTPTSL